MYAFRVKVPFSPLQFGLYLQRYFRYFTQSHGRKRQNHSSEPQHKVELGPCKLSTWLFSIPYLHAQNSTVKGIKATLLLQVVVVWGEILCLPKLYHCAVMNTIKMNITHLQH